MRIGATGAGCLGEHPCRVAAQKRFERTRHEEQPLHGAHLINTKMQAARISTDQTTMKQPTKKQEGDLIGRPPFSIFEHLCRFAKTPAKGQKFCYPDDLVDGSGLLAPILLALPVFAVSEAVRVFYQSGHRRRLVVHVDAQVQDRGLHILVPEQVLDRFERHPGQPQQPSERAPQGVIREPEPDPFRDRGDQLVDRGALVGSQLPARS